MILIHSQCDGHPMVEQVITLSFSAKVDLADFWVSSNGDQGLLEALEKSGTCLQSVWQRSTRTIETPRVFQPNH